MMRPSASILHILLLMALAVRVAFGAPCCLTFPDNFAGDHADAGHEMMAMAAHGEPSHADLAHAGHTDRADSNGHSGHDGDNTAKPCCSACGPTLPSSDADAFVAAPLPDSHFYPRFAQLPPLAAHRQYNARGPPLVI